MAPLPYRTRFKGHHVWYIHSFLLMTLVDNISSRVTYKLESNKKQIKILFFFFYLIGLAFFTGSSSALGGTVQRQVHSLHHSVVSQFLYNRCFSE